MDDVDINIEEDQILDLDHDGWVLEALMEQGNRVADIARMIAPVWPYGSKGGAISIAAHSGQDVSGYYVEVSWDDPHNYMRFPNGGTIYQAAQHFMERALDEAIGGVL